MSPPSAPPVAAQRLPWAHSLVVFADLAGTFVFALEGAFAAVGAHLDLFGVMVLAFATALGGGVLRDVLMGSLPPNALRGFSYAGTAFAAAEIASGPMVSMSDRGARIRVHATGVGAPFSDSTVTIASPMPNDVSAFSKS